jgi:transposase-like protein
MAKTKENSPKTLVEAIVYFSDPERAFAFVKDLRWGDEPVTCPRCGHDEHSFVSTRKIWKCKGCKRQFSLKVGTIFEDSPIGWDKWLPAVWLTANAKNSISSHELSRSLGVTQKTAWFMLHRIRLAMESQTFEKLTGPVEVDETYVGGKVKNMHQAQKNRRISWRGNAGKVPVQGARAREDGTVRAEVIPEGQNYKQNVHQWIEPGSVVYTDEAKAYQGLESEYTHEVITHGREYVRGDVHTNGIESFWALFKRALKGTQVHVDRRHMNRYVTERTFAYNNRDLTDIGRMKAAMSGVAGRGLTYAQLTGA